METFEPEMLDVAGSQYTALMLSSPSTTHSILFLILIAILVSIFFRKLHEEDKGLPPGPLGLPFLGYYPFLGKWPAETFHNLKKKYGGVYSIRLGNKNCVVIGDVEALREAYAKEAFHGRPPDSPFKINTQIQSLVQFAGKPWLEQRRFSLTVLRNLGFGKTRMEDVIKSEVSLLIEEYEKSDRGPKVFHDFIALSTVNVIGVLLFGRQFPYDDPQRHILDRYLKEISPFHDQMSPHAFFPWARNLIFKLPFLRYQQAPKLVKELSNFTRDEIDQHEASVDPNDPRDYIDSYLLETEKPETDKVTFTKNVLNGNVALFLRAGSLTTRATVEWAMLGTALHPEVQKLVHQEIDRVVGTDRQIEWSDHFRMPYTVAVLNETQRWRTIVPINLLRFTNEETTVRGYRIPAQTVVITNLWGIHNEDTVWPEPEKFKPERMLDPTGKEHIKTDSFVSFSYGRRSCPGKSLANMEMFLYYAMLLQKYRVCLPDGDPIPTKEDLKGESHITAHPKNLRLILKKRS